MFGIGKKQAQPSAVAVVEEQPTIAMVLEKHLGSPKSVEVTPELLKKAGKAFSTALGKLEKVEETEANEHNIRTAIADTLLRRLELGFLGQHNPGDKNLPAFAVFNINERGVCHLPCWHEGDRHPRSQLYGKLWRQECGDRLNCHCTETQFSGIIPEAQKQLMSAAKELFGGNIAIIAEAPAEAWKQKQIPRADPIIVGYSQCGDDTIAWEITHYNPTTAEQHALSEFRL